MVLGERKQKILGAVVRDYVETVRPVGSEDLAVRYAAWGVKSATIRNELAELADMGFLRQPHTSAGRIPSDQGYRFYVDYLMETESPSQFAGAADSEMDAALALESLLRHTCALLTRITSYTAVATRPRPADTVVNEIFLTPVSDNRLLVAVLLSTGQVQNRLLPAPDLNKHRRDDLAPLTSADVDSLGRALNAWFAGKSLVSIISSDAPGAEAHGPTDLDAPMRSLWALIAHAVRHAVGEVADERQVVLEGATEIFKQPEFRDAAKSEGVLDTLQRGALMFQIVSRSRAQVAVVIGAENRVAAMHDCSVVTAPYYVGTKLRGAIGVVGPTRMNYDRAVPAVDFFAATLSNTLTYLRT
jgi:heat-inducible transcriptional repressor